MRSIQKSEVIVLQVLSTDLHGGYKHRSGTSQASPMVAGVAGLLLSKNSLLTPAQVQRILEIYADDVESPGRDAKTGWGRLNAGRALEAEFGPPVSNAPPASCPPTPIPVPTPTSANSIQSREDDLISLYRQLRDEVLSPSEIGQGYIEDYYEHGLELSAILLTDADLRTRTAQFLEDAAPAFGSLLPNSTEEVVLTQALYDEADGLVHNLAQAGSPELHDEMLQTWEDMALDEHIGETAAEIWEEMQQSAIYLPIILKSD